MARILFTWECGGGLGHLVFYSELIDRLTQDGHKVMFAVRSLASAVRVFGDRPVALIQAPLRMELLAGGVPSPRSYLHVLRNQGFASPDGLLGRFRAWMAIYEAWQPELIVADHAPTAVFTAKHYGRARLVMSGGGFMVPPDTHPFQAFPIEPMASEQDRLAEEQSFLERHINPHMRSVGGKPYDRLCDAFRVDSHWLCQFRETDHYPQRGPTNYLGTGPSPGGESPVWPAGEGPKLFAYIKPHSDLETLLELIRGKGMPTLIKGDELPPAIEQRFTGPTMRFADKLQDMVEVTRICDLGITNGSVNVSSLFLRAGKPVLMMPLHVEQLISSNMIERNGCGISVDYLAKPDFCYETALADLLAPDNRYRKAAQDYAERHSDYDPGEAVDFMYADVNRLLEN